jgi:putative RNA 2'-phosphotransferase
MSNTTAIPPSPPSISPARLKSYSKFLSKHLRHSPEAIGLSLEVGGWVSVTDLLSACAKFGMPIDGDILRLIVSANDKQRFGFDASQTRIRANQGHSVAIDLQLPEVEPPALLYHGTARQSVVAILASGIEARSRHHVHLSTDQATARNVGQRHGQPVVLLVQAGEMWRNNYVFYCSDNGVWLTEQVPSQFLSVVP